MALEKTNFTQVDILISSKINDMQDAGTVKRKGLILCQLS